MISLNQKQSHCYYKYVHHELAVYLQNVNICLNNVVNKFNKHIDNKLNKHVSIKHAFGYKCLRHTLPLLLINILDIVKEKLS